MGDRVACGVINEDTKVTKSQFKIQCEFKIRELSSKINTDY